MNQIKEQVQAAVSELLEKAQLKAGDLLIVGCSTSEVMGQHIGSGSSLEAAEALFAGISPLLAERGISLAAQCCEHLNRALILEREAAEKRGLLPVNAVPQPKAGGSFATVVYRNLKQPVAVEHLQADAGLDIGNTLIGMHLKEVVVPLRLSVQKIGDAHVTAARTRAKFIGGVRACYDETML